MRLATVRGTGHHVFLTHTRRSLDLLREFLSEPAMVAKNSCGD
jgi:hypothetical protein